MLFHLHERSSLLVFPAFQAVQGLQEEFSLLNTQVTAVSLDSVYPEVMFLAYTNKATLPKQPGERGREQQEDWLRPREVPAEEM